MGINVKPTDTQTSDTYATHTLKDNLTHGINTKEPYQCSFCYWIRCEENIVTIITYVAIIMIVLIVLIVLAKLMKKRRK